MQTGKEDLSGPAAEEPRVITSCPRPHVLVVTLNRPARRNALDNALIGALGALLQEAASDPATRCVVLTGGDRFFAAGADVSEMQVRGFEALDNPARRAAWRAVERFPKPLIAAVEGYAFGGGHELVMLADIVVAGCSARFAQPEVNLGILPGDGATQRLTRIVGKPLAMRMILTGEPIDAETARAAGLVSDIVEDGQVMARALELAQAIAAKPPLATCLAKEAVLAAYDTVLAAGLDAERAAIRQAFTTADQREGMAAFAERRQPVFTGG